MREDEIDDICECLAEAWRKVPDLRLGQLIVDSLPAPLSIGQIFYAKDWNLIESIEEFSKLCTRES